MESPARSRKRPAATDLTSEQPLSKRLECLSIRQAQHSGPHHVQPQPQLQLQVQQAPAITETMDLDLPPHTVYIHSLSDSDSDSEAEEGKVVFPRDIEKRMTGVPAHVLRASVSKDKEAPEVSMALVLYSVPRTLSAGGDEEDAVRKAVMESRARVRIKRALEEREKAEQEEREWVNGMRMVEGMAMREGTYTGNGMDAVAVVYDPDAMDIE